jgi:orotate phosphoribosyltransferase
MNVVPLERGNSEQKKLADTARASLLQKIVDKSYRYSPTAEFKLASGATSNFYFDMKMTMLDPEGISLIADVLADRLSKHGAKYVAGLELGAVPLIMAACMKGYHALIVRKDKKGHGTKKLVEGPMPGAGEEVILLDDVTTKGDSVLTAVKEVRAAGCVVKTVITLVDRQDEARQKLLANGVTLEPIFTLGDFHKG